MKKFLATLFLAVTMMMVVAQAQDCGHWECVYMTGQAGADCMEASTNNGDDCMTCTFVPDAPAPSCAWWDIMCWIS